jgi:cell division protein FtsL
MEYILYCLFITVFIILGLNIIYRRKYNKTIKYEIEREKHRYIE